MNILPKKSWHVRSRDNIEKVKRDEARAAEEQKEKEARIALAEQEARTEMLRIKARSKYSDTSSSSYSLQAQVTQPAGEVVPSEASQSLPRTHINFFSEIESGSITQKSNKDHEAEKKKEQEAYEKKIGLLVGLGQSSIESQTVKPWYQHSRQREESKTESVDTDTNDMKRKASLDPMNDMMRFLGKKSKSGADTKSGEQSQRLGDKKFQPTGGLPGTTSLMTMFTKYKNKSKEDNSKEKDMHHKRHKEKRKRHHKLKKSKRHRDSKHREKKSHTQKSKHKRKSKHRNRDDSASTDSDRDRRKKKSRRQEKKHKHKSKHYSDSESSSGNDSYSDSGSMNSSSSEDDESQAKLKLKSSAPTIEQLRAERLRREAAERTKTERLLAGKPLEDKAPAEPQITDKLDGKYNSQFNPHLARKQQPKLPLF